MNAKKATSVACLAACVLVIAALWLPAQAKNTRQIYYNSEDLLTPLLGAPQADTIEIYSEDFSDGESGWVGKDIWAQDPYWHQAFYDDGAGPLGVMWCGLESAPGWASASGYGNSWRQSLVKPFTVIPGAAIEGSMQYDMEPGIDSLRLQVSTDGGTTYDTLGAYSGTSAGFEPFSVSLDAYAGQDVLIRFFFTSDGSWSDEDGLYDSNGGARLDWVQVTGYPADDFESGDNGWTALGVDPYPVQFRLVETPVCEATPPCTGYSYTWVCYDPATGVFPFTPTRDLTLTVESPVIDIEPNLTQYLLRFDVYLNLPQDNLVLYQWEVAAPPPEQGGYWQGDNFVRSGTTGFTTVTYDITSQIPAGTTQIKVRLLAHDMYYVWGGSVGSGNFHTSAPMFDNVRILGSMDPDLDGDGVPVPQDICPTVDASFFDSNADGCLDRGLSGRHVEYWDHAAFPLTYVINEDGCPTVSDGSEFAAIEQGYSAWTAAPGLDASVTYGGTTPQNDAQAMDMVNLVTFDDPDYRFGVGVIAVGLTTSFTEPTVLSGTQYRPGQIMDSDMIFNPGKSFRTATSGPADGTYIEAVATHEAGHFFGLAHSAILSSTMYFVLPPGLEAASLEADDRQAMYEAYATSLLSSNVLRGRIYDGYTGLRVAGAAVFAVDAATGDTVACEYSLPSSLGTSIYSFEFWGLPPGNYYVAVHPLDGSSAIGYMEPAYINDFIAGCAQTSFVPEWYNTGENSTDDPAARTAVTMAATGSRTIGIYTNIDAVPPTVVATAPAPGETGVSIGTSTLLAFSEPINDATIAGNFSLTDVGSGEFMAGNASVLNDDSLIAFVPANGLAFSATYRLTLGTGLQDKFGNGLAEPFEMLFTTEVEPDVALASLAPSKGSTGILVSVNGKGFDPVPANNTVTFAGVPAAVSQASPTQLVVTVPEGAVSGVVHIYNHTQGKTSNDLQFTVLSPDEVPKGFESGVSELSSTPRALTVLPDGSYAYMATDGGAQAVIVDPALSGYLTSVSIPISGGLSDIACSPTGSRVYGVSYDSQKLYRIDATPSSIGLLSEKAVGACPRGILVHPKGHRAYIPTDEGEIGIWDLEEASTTFECQVGAIVPPDPNIRGGLATDPAGNLLLALAGTGKLFVFDLNTNGLVATVKVGPDPRDVAVDRVGRFAYVADGTGVVSVVSLDSHTWQQNIRVGGSLRGISVTPAGTFAYAVNREMNLLEAVDLRPTSAAYRSIATRIALPINPVDIDLSPDGDYAFTVSEAEQRLIVTAVGLGPELATLSCAAGPVGGKVVLAGSDFLAGTSTSVTFNGSAATPERYANDMLVVTVPAAAATGKVSVVTSSAGEPSLTSNAIYFEVLGATVRDALRLATALPGKPPTATDGGSVFQISPAGDYIALADRSGGFHVLVTDPANPKYHQYAGSLALGSVAEDIAISPDGDRAFAVLPAVDKVRVVGADRLKQDFLTSIAAVDFSGIAGSNIARAEVSPDGSILLVSDPGTAQVHFVDIVASSPTAYHVVASVPLASGARNGIVREMAFHPGGAYAYLAVEDSDPAVVLVLDTSPTSPGYRTVLYAVTLPGAAPQEVPVSLGFTPWGSRCLVLTSQVVGTPHRSVVMLNSASPASPSVAATLSLGGTAAPAAERIEVSPRGDRAIAGVRGAGLYNIRIQTAPDALALVEQVGSPADFGTTVGLDYAANASAFYCLSEATDKLLVYDFSAVQTMAALSGNGQAGVISQMLARPLRVQVSASGGSAAGIPVTFTVTSGGGRFAATGSALQVVSTGSDGVAEVKWVLGSALGTAAQTVAAAAAGLGGSPVTFTADGLADPATLPLTVAGVVPGDGTGDVSISTAVQAAFSRPVDPASVGPSTFFIHTGDMVAVPAVIGFSDGNRRVSLSPTTGLEPDTDYEIRITTGILNTEGGALAGEFTSSFTTEPPPPVVLHSIAPISGSENVTVVLAGSGFDPDPTFNKVLFNAIEASVTSGAKDYLVATVPLHAATGLVRVVNTATADTSNALDFTVLTPDAIPINNVITSVSTGSGTHSVSITPDGTLAYAVSPYANRVVVIGLRKLAVVSTIPVGENPVAVAIDPQGKFAYVANYLDGTVSVIDADRSSPSFNRVVGAVVVGGGPSDLVVTPDGDGLIVANPVWGEISFVDADSSSETYRSVIASVATGAGSSTVAITPDGGYVYVGTGYGYLVISAGSRTVISSVATGSGTSTVAITPDGALLALLTTEGVVNIYDIRPGSPRENQVISSLRTSSGTVNVAISPDGGFLYLVQGAGDFIFVVALDLSTVVGVHEDGADLPPLSLEATIVDTLTAGEDPFDVAFDPTGSGNFVITNGGDYTITVFGTPPPPSGPGVLAGRATANCPASGTGLLGVEIDVFKAGTGEIGANLRTDAGGYYLTELPVGDYMVTLVTPLGYTVVAEETPATISSGDTASVSFALQCETIIPDPRKMSFWKHQVAVALKGNGTYEVDGTTLCGYLDLIASHFNSNLLNPVVVYEPPASGGCADKLEVAKDVLNLQGSTAMVAQARQELIALLFNVAAQKLHLAAAASPDNATVSMAITYVDRLIDDGIAENDSLARMIAKKINDGKQVAAGVIPADTPDIIYVVRGRNFGVSQNGPNPFSQITTIEFAIPEASHVTLAIYDVTGRLVRTLVDGNCKPNVYRASWDGTDNSGRLVASGPYFYRFEAGRFSATKKMMLVK